MTNRDHYKKKSAGDEIHWKEFLPSRKEPDELSILRTESLDEAAVWQLGAAVITQASGRAIVSRGDLTLAIVQSSEVQGGDVPSAVEIQRRLE